VELRVPERVYLRSYNPTYEGHPGQIKKAARSMVRAKRPVLYVGGGAISSDASPELRELADLTQIPITQTLMGLGAFPMADPLSLDMLGMHGTYYANMAVHHSDCLVAVAARFDDRVTGRSTRSRRMRRSSTSTSTPRRSPRTSRWTSRSWATASGCCAAWWRRCGRS